MPYGQIKVDEITFTNAGVDQTISVSGVVASISGNITATGTISGNVIRGGTTVSGATVTGTAGQFGTITGNTAGFTTVTGTTVTGTTANFVTVSGTTVTGTTAQFTTITGGTAGFTTITGTTVTGTTANFVTVSGTTVTGNVGNFTTITGGSAGFTTVTGTTITGTTLTVASGTFTGNSTAAAFIPTGSTVPTNGVYLPSANSVAISTNGTGRLFVDALGRVAVGNSVPTTVLSGPTLQIGNTTATASELGFLTSTTGTNAIYFGDGSSTAAYSGYIEYSHTNNFLRFGTNDNERLRITSAGLVGIGTSTTTLGGNPFRLAVVGTKTYSELIPRDGLAIADNTATAQGVGGSITLHGIYDGSGNYTAFGGIEGQKENGTSGNYAGALVLKSRTFLGNLNEAIRIDSAQRVGIGTTSPTAILDCQTDSTSKIKFSAAVAATPSISFDSNSVSDVARITAAESSSGGVLILNTKTTGGVLTEKARITQSGQLLVGTSSARDFFGGTDTPALQVEGLGNAGRELSVTSSTASGSGGVVLLAKQRSGAVGGQTIVQSGDQLGYLGFQGSDGTKMLPGAAIEATVDGTPGVNDLPTRLVFSTTADGASSPTEAMRINNQREVLIGTNTRTANGGVLQVSNGITFPATQSACSDPNTLDDYEEGSCTITLSDSLGNNATMGAGNVFQYRKIGSFVLVSGTLAWSSTSALSAGSRIRINGLPFVASGTTDMRWPAINGSSSSGSFLITRSELSFGLDFGNSFIWGVKTSGNNVDGSLTKADLGSSGVLYGLAITYNT